MKLDQLPQDVVEDLKENHSIEEIEKMSGSQVVRAWLEWHGIVGYSDPILALTRICNANDDMESALDTWES